MRAKLPIALALGALLVLPVLAQTLNARTVQTDDPVSVVPVAGDTLTLPQGGGQNTASMPSRGMTMAQVEQLHGAPELRRAAVGDPPITRWEYSGFVVYFEYRHVITSVAKVSR